MRWALLVGLFLAGIASAFGAEQQRKLPVVPSAEFRIAEVFDNRLELFIELYATKDPNVVDYATGRKSCG